LSGFIGILNLDGAPVDQELLGRMTQALGFRGPDGQAIWCSANVGLGHAMFRAARESVAESQPFEHEHRLWIVADARVDGRSDLIEQLNANPLNNRNVSLATPNVELIVAAYERWGEACVDHLIGDFSFAIWDTLERRLFCARDQMGVKPFFYAHVGSCLVFSNTLDCVRMHPAVSKRLNDLAIADFLLFDMNQDPSTTSFADVRRLPPAHTLVCQQGEVSVRRYWELSVTRPIQYARDEEYVERFRELLDASVADRLRTDSVGVLMSGGLDSPTVAASARRVVNLQRNGTSISAYTEVIDSLIPHEERPYATLVAEALQIPIEFSIGDCLRVFERADQSEYRSTEPAHSACADRSRDQLRTASARSRVVLTGFGGDPSLCGRISVHFGELLRTRHFGRAISDALRYLACERRLSRLYLRTRWRILFQPDKQGPCYPEWLNEDFEKRLDLRERWKSLRGGAPLHEAVRPEAQQAMADSMWPLLFEGYDCGVSRVPVEVRHPFFDLRLVNFLLALPRLPWCSDKELLREAARGVLPDAVRLRRKSPLRSDPLLALLQRPDSAWVDRFEAVPELARYVVRSRIPAVHRDTVSWRAWTSLRPLSLNYWLRGDAEIG
jgi:asparagine synthase (glutamine-hydrolysing)